MHRKNIAGRAAANRVLDVVFTEGFAQVPGRSATAVGTVTAGRDLPGDWLSLTASCQLRRNDLPDHPYCQPADSTRKLLPTRTTRPWL